MTKQKFKTMLGVTADKTKIRFPTMTSLKLDGIRCVCIDGKLLSRSLKPIRNIQLQEKFKDMMSYSKENNVIFDGEFYSHSLTFQEITSMVNSSDKDVSECLKFNCFDLIKSNDFSMPFKDRIALLSKLEISNVIKVEQFIIDSVEGINKMFDKALDEDYEGLIVRCPNGEYKFGRSTINQGWLLKLKPFKTFDTKVLGFVERMENLNESQINELGRSFKRDTKADKKPTGICSALITEYDGHKMKVTLTGDEAFRKEIWDNQGTYLGKMFEFKGMLIGSKNCPRHPTFIRFRGDRDE